MVDSEFQASASSSGKWGPTTGSGSRGAAHQGNPKAADRENARGGPSVWRTGPGWTGVQASRAKRKERGRILHLPRPGPARTVPARATVRACAASCRAASTPDPAAATSSVTAPVATQVANTALKKLQRQQRRRRRLRNFRLLAAYPPTGEDAAGPRRAPLPAGWGPLRQCHLVVGGANQAREGDWAGVWDTDKIQKGASELLDVKGRIVCSVSLLIHFFHSTNIY